ncbi:mRNA-degrading endonuclease toxin of MazEF toxin-antitoxin module [Kitasatospora gansuensis]|uniref:mRNA-degrading endonuclease toxin of MazEF toxin-antitoxin module n=1 Tax=Kitasatospora gansuensis TaxID=258050 RepID=A0A7W7SEQ5_9ACTN|nr:type II toxin-antitoxin system PemK/MazF family toxin [Kitasatospora gansuensis]MBB4949083.1 mRNA-degrading endonuclease toxin of MazEF toxin-antitoxin module [Kitasatospora gansuensis]
MEKWLIAALVVLVLLAVLVAVRRRRTPAPAGGPVAREVWWAEVPFEDGPGTKDRPCLVLRVNRRTATVAKITSKRRDDRLGVLALPPGAVGDRQGRASWLETDELREVPLRAFRRRVGPLDAPTWAKAQRALR